MFGCGLLCCVVGFVCGCCVLIVVLRFMCVVVDVLGLMGWCIGVAVCCSVLCAVRVGVFVVGVVFVVVLVCVAVCRCVWVLFCFVDGVVVRLRWYCWFDVRCVVLLRFVWSVMCCCICCVVVFCVGVFVVRWCVRV